MPIKLKLNSNIIGDKVFKAVPRGYDAYEVDKFLDSIISDYEKVEANVLLEKTEKENLERKIAALENEKEQLEIELGRLKSKYSNVKPTDNVTDENLNLIKRINTLETFLWRNGFNPKTIK